MRQLIWIVLCAAAVLATGCATNPSAYRCPLDAAASSEGDVARDDSGSCYDDDAMENSMIEQVVEMFEVSKTVPMDTLIEQLERKDCKLDLSKPSTSQMSRADVYSKLKSGVVVVFALYKCTKCDKWHVAPAAGIVLTDSGVIATCHHVVDSPDRKALAVMTAEGDIYPVMKVLTSDAAEDIAIIEIKAKGLTPLPLAADEPVGNNITVISHPDKRYYTLTEGIVSRYFIQDMDGTPVRRMAVTADFARGSSGAPVFNEFGNVVGMVTRTHSVYYTHEEGHHSGRQMVIGYCVPAESILKLVSGCESAE